jgi:hypothetical protein
MDGRGTRSLAIHLTLNASSVGVEDYFSGNFTQAKFLRGQDAAELEKRIGYGSGRLASGYWLLFALENPPPRTSSSADTHIFPGRGSAI